MVTVLDLDLSISLDTDLSMSKLVSRSMLRSVVDLVGDPYYWKGNHKPDMLKFQVVY